MKKLSAWQIVLLVIFYPVGICVWIYRVWKKKRIKVERDAATRARVEARVQKIDAACSTAPDYEFKVFKVVGVTFKNPGNKSRQAILRKMRFRDEPFNKDGVDITITRGEYDGEPAFSVFAEGLQVGNIGRDDVPFFVSRWSDFAGVYNATVTGGGTSDDGRPLNYGMTITCRFDK